MNDPAGLALIASLTVSAACTQHSWTAARTIRQNHAAAHCPAVARA